MDDPRSNSELLGCDGIPLLMTGKTETVRMPEEEDQMNSENKSRQQREQHAELENETMEVEWAPSTPARENIQPSVRTRMQEK